MVTQITSSTTCAKNLVSVNNGKAVTTSLQVAEVFNKLHRHVLRDIRNLECSSNFQESNFGLSFYHSKLLNGGYKKQPMYYITKDGFVFLAMGFTGKVAAQFKEAYINAFNEMENKLKGVTIKEEEIVTYLRSLCEDIDGKIKEHDKQLQKQFKSSPNPAIISPALSCSEDLKAKLKEIFVIFNNNIQFGMFAWAKLESLEKEYRGIRKALAGWRTSF